MPLGVVGMSDSSRTPANWPAAFAVGLHAALCRRIPPAIPAAELEPLTRELTEALEQGQLTVSFNKELRHLAEASGWLAGEAAPLLVQDDRIGWHRWLQAMEDVVEALVARSSLPPHQPDVVPAPDVPEGLNAEQRAAVCALDQASVVLLSGGPGTGKTSTVVELLRRAEALQPDLRIGLAAPTGKAARRLGDAVLASRPPLPCSTLHRWLEAGARGFGRGADRPLDLDLLVIDEMSMLDLALAQALIAALPPQCRLVLVGDPAQLPPVGSGAVWHRLQEADVRPRFGTGAVHLVQTYRNRGALATLAAALREGGMTAFCHAIDALPADGNVRVERGSPWRLPPLVRQRWRERLQRLAALSQGLDRCDTAALAAAAQPLLAAVESELVLCPRRRGPWSLEDLNRSLLGDVNADDPARWPTGLPVICGGNQPELGLANGDLGVVIGRGETRRLLFRTVDGEGSVQVQRLHPARLRRLEPALALTIHRAQGSEADRVMVLWPDPLEPRDSSDHDQRLLYTAITRTRASLDLVVVS